MLSYQSKGKKLFVNISSIINYSLNSVEDVMFESDWSPFSINQLQKCSIRAHKEVFYKYFKAWMTLLCDLPEISLTALDFPKIEKWVKLCYKYFKSRMHY